MSGPFGTVALEYLAAGMAAIPCGGENGKRPLVKFRQFLERPPPTYAVKRWAETHPEANIGIVTGAASGVTLVDIDDPNQLDSTIQRCGETPVMAETPSGGFHLLYRHNAERSRNRAFEGVDVKARGGVWIAPPSSRSGRPYRFTRGGLEAFERLPMAKGLDALRAAPARPGGALPAPGARNEWLFRKCLWAARHVDCENDLVDVALTQNSDWPDPLPPEEAMRAARSAWRYQTEGRNWSGQELRAVVLISEIKSLEPDALYLLARLRAAHACRRGSFAVAKTFADALGWTARRFYKARGQLLDSGFLECIHEGGRGGKRGDPSLFTLRTTGVISHHDRIEHAALTKQ